MAWIDNKKVYNVVPQTWIIECLKIYKISDQIINFINFHGKLESGITRGENLKSRLRGRFTLVPICYSTYLGSAQGATN